MVARGVARGVNMPCRMREHEMFGPTSEKWCMFMSLYYCNGKSNGVGRK